jgi:soluble lytic murein transglycosylase-like protein
MLINDVPVDCINTAAIEYHVPALLVIAVLKIEGGRVGMANVNKNGTVDYGPMQINSSWLKDLVHYGYTAHDIQYDPCMNVNAGAWILAQEIANDGRIWKGVGNYHSHTYWRNISYQQKVDVVVKNLSDILSGKD